LRALRAKFARFLVFGFFDFFIALNFDTGMFFPFFALAVLRSLPRFDFLMWIPDLRLRAIFHLLLARLVLRRPTDAASCFGLRFPSTFLR